MTSLCLSFECRVVNSKLLLLLLMLLALVNSVESLLVSIFADVALVFYILMFYYVVSY